MNLLLYGFAPESNPTCRLQFGRAVCEDSDSKFNPIFPEATEMAKQNPAKPKAPLPTPASCTVYFRSSPALSFLFATNAQAQPFLAQYQEYLAKGLPKYTSVVSGVPQNKQTYTVYISLPDVVGILLTSTG
jgi:hypothetical protein